MAQTLCATGIVILYAVTFACHSLYHFPWFGQFSTFGLMAVITFAAFHLAVRMEARVVALLGLVGGFLTPVLLSSGVDNPAGLFLYIGLLDAGLLAVAFRRQWPFLTLLGAIGTVAMQLAWVGRFFTVEKVFVALVVFLGFQLLFLVAFVIGEKRNQRNPWLSTSAGILPLVTLAFSFYLLAFAQLGSRPGVIFSFALGADLCLLALAVAGPALQRWHLVAGTVVFSLLASWMTRYLNAELLSWGLGLSVGFAALHTLFPVALARLRPAQPVLWMGHLFPPLALGLILIPLLQEATVSFAIWPAVLLLNLLAMGLAWLTVSIAVILGAVALTGFLAAVWIVRLPAEVTSLPEILLVVGGFAIIFFVFGAAAVKRIQAGKAFGDGPSLEKQLQSIIGLDLTSPEAAAQIPAFSAILPFLLLVLVLVRVPTPTPAPVFGLGLLLAVLLLGLALYTALDLLVPVSLLCVLALEYTWISRGAAAPESLTALIWPLTFYVTYTVFPFLFRNRLQNRVLPWATAALAGPVHFYLLYRIVAPHWMQAMLGAVPALLSVPMLAAVQYVRTRFSPDAPLRLTLLAWFGASALFFITLIVPIQFDRQWITVGWALEGAALLWLFHRVPHPGLRAAGVVLLLVAFARLTLNPAVIGYPRSTGIRVFNWYLYAYGITIVCLLIGGRLLAPPRHLVWKQNAPPLLYTLATLLAFLLVNIEIADYYSEGPTLKLELSGNLAQDMTYSIAWGLFALALLIIGIWKGLVAVRYAAIGLLLVTLIKLFLHDLSNLGQLYRIGAFLAVAVILFFASFLYQRFVSADRTKEDQ